MTLAHKIKVLVIYEDEKTGKKGKQMIPLNEIIADFHNRIKKLERYGS